MPAVRWAIAGTCRLGFPPRALPATTAPSRNFSSGGNAAASDLSLLATGARVRQSAQKAAASSAWDWPSEWISRPAPARSALAKCFVHSRSCLWINPSGPINQAVTFLLMGPLDGPDFLSPHPFGCGPDRAEHRELRGRGSRSKRFMEDGETRAFGQLPATRVKG